MSEVSVPGGKPDKMKKQNLNVVIPPSAALTKRASTSAPHTPESIRRQLLKGRMGTTSFSLHDKKEKMEFNQMMMRMSAADARPLSYQERSLSLVEADLGSYSICGDSISMGGAGLNKRHLTSSVFSKSKKESILLNRRSMPVTHFENRYREKFDVDTNLPQIDVESIENHLYQAREEEKKRRSDREEIRKRLALESDDVVGDKGIGRKPSLHCRLQSSMNLQICFMNETASDSESPNSDTEGKCGQPASLPCVPAKTTDTFQGTQAAAQSTEDFQTVHYRIQMEAREALSQAKEIARQKMSQEKDLRVSPIKDMLKNSLEKVGIQLQSKRRRLTRQMLTEMNVAQLQVVVNDLHSHIEMLNEALVSLLLERDDLHMEQDSMLVDIEDLTRYLAAKDTAPFQSLPVILNKNLHPKK